MVVAVPDFATHYHLARRPPFLNLSELSSDELPAVLEALRAELLAGDNHRRFGQLYVKLRGETERRLREGFASQGGLMTRTAPHYFVLGESAWFQALSPEMEAVRVPLVDLPEESTSVTLWDSFSAMGAGEEHGLPVAPTELLGRVHRLTDLGELIAEFGLPDPAASGNPMDAHHTFVEIQLWTDEPVRRYLR